MKLNAPDDLLKKKKKKYIRGSNPDVFFNLHLILMIDTYSLKSLIMWSSADTFFQTTVGISVGIELPTFLVFMES